MKLVLTGDWPDDPVKRRECCFEAAVQLLPTILPMIIDNHTPEQLTACKYMLSWIHMYPKRMNKFDQDRFDESTGDGAQAFEDLYNEINIRTEGDLSRCCALLMEFPWLLGTMKALYVQVGSEIERQKGG